MVQCAHCDQQILGQSVALPVTVDESVEELPSAETKFEFCSERCKRDFFDWLTDFGREVSQSASSEE